MLIVEDQSQQRPGTFERHSLLQVLRVSTLMAALLTIDSKCCSEIQCQCGEPLKNSVRTFGLWHLASRNKYRRCRWYLVLLCFRRRWYSLLMSLGMYVWISLAPTRWSSRSYTIHAAHKDMLILCSISMLNIKYTFNINFNFKLPMFPIPLRHYPLATLLGLKSPATSGVAPYAFAY